MSPDALNAAIVSSCSGRWREARDLADALHESRRRVRQQLLALERWGCVLRARATDSPHGSEWAWRATGVQPPQPRVATGLGVTMIRVIAPRIITAMQAGAETASQIAYATRTTRRTADGRLRTLAAAGIVSGSGGKWRLTGVPLPEPQEERPHSERARVRRAALLQVLRDAHEPMTTGAVATAARRSWAVTQRDLLVLAVSGHVVDVSDHTDTYRLWVAT